PRVGGVDDVSVRRPDLRVPAVRPAVDPRPLRAAVDEEDRRVLLRRVEGRRLDDPRLQLPAVGGVGEALGDLARPELAQAGPGDRPSRPALQIPAGRDSVLVPKTRRPAPTSSPATDPPVQRAAGAPPAIPTR